MTSQTSEIVVGLTDILAPVDQYAHRLLGDAERSGSPSAEFGVSEYVTWNNGSETIGMTVFVAAQKPTPEHFSLRVAFTCNGSEVFYFVYEDHIINWVLGLLSANGWESIPSEHSNQQARVSWEAEGFVFFVKRSAA